MTRSRPLVVATVNTYFGRAVTDDAGLEALGNADVLLMQELFSLATSELEPRLDKYGFELLAAGRHFGLAIALKSTSAFTRMDKPARSTVLQPIGSLERAAIRRFAKQQLEYTDLGVLAAQLETPEGRQLTVATTHLPVVTSFRQRARFLTQLVPELAEPYFEGRLVLGGDMNHYPGPKRADLAFRRAAGLTAVDLGTERTWPSKKGAASGDKLRNLLGGQLDDILYRGSGMNVVHRDVVDVASDHRALVATFMINIDHR